MLSQPEQLSFPLLLFNSGFKILPDAGACLFLNQAVSCRDISLHLELQCMERNRGCRVAGPPCSRRSFPFCLNEIKTNYESNSSCWATRGRVVNTVVPHYLGFWLTAAGRRCVDGVKGKLLCAASPYRLQCLLQAVSFSNKWISNTYLL